MSNGSPGGRDCEAEIAELREKLKNFETLKLKFGDINLKMWELKEALEAAQEKNELLLRNILPERVIADLRENGRSAPEYFENVTVFFSDIAGFTEKSSRMDPVRLIGELNSIFGEFDRIFAANRCVRIKTVGDAYLGVSGLPEPDGNHARNILSAAREAMRFVAERNRRAAADGGMVWEMRMGIHTGGVVGGIVGIEKYIYDVFGDAVNTASRLEDAAEPMTINLSRAVVEAAGADCGFRFVPRGGRRVKGKGMMEMFFLDWREEAS